MGGRDQIYEILAMRGDETALNDSIRGDAGQCARVRIFK
jgi:hypothetical protein